MPTRSLFCQEGSPKVGGPFKRSDGPDPAATVSNGPGSHWGPPCHLVHLTVPCTHVAVVNVEDVNFGSRLNFLYSGPVPAMASRAELKGQPWGVAAPGSRPPGALATAGERAQHFSPRAPGAHPWVSQRTVLDSTKAQPWGTVVTI